MSYDIAAALDHDPLLSRYEEYKSRNHEGGRHSVSRDELVILQGHCVFLSCSGCKATSRIVLETHPARNQDATATTIIYPTIGSNERGRTLNRNGSRITSTRTGGTLVMSALSSEK